MRRHRLLLWILVLALAAGSLGISGCRTFGAPKTAFDVLRLTQSMTVSDVSHEAVFYADGFTVRVTFDGTEDRENHVTAGTLWITAEGRPPAALDPDRLYPEWWEDIHLKAAEITLTDGVLTADLSALLAEDGCENLAEEAVWLAAQADGRNVSDVAEAKADASLSPLKRLAAMIIAWQGGESFAAYGGKAALAVMTDRQVTGLVTAFLKVSEESLQQLLSARGVYADLGAFPEETRQSVLRLKEAFAAGLEAGAEAAPGVSGKGTHRDEYPLTVKGEAWEAFLPAVFGSWREDFETLWDDVSAVAASADHPNPFLDAVEGLPLASAFLPLGLTVTEVRTGLSSLEDYGKTVDLVLHAGTRIGRELAAAGCEAEALITYDKMDDVRTVTTEWAFTLPDLSVLGEAEGSVTAELSTSRTETGEAPDTDRVDAAVCMDLAGILTLADAVWQAAGGE